MDARNALLLILLTVTTTTFSQSLVDEFMRQKIGVAKELREAPDFELRDLKGKKRKLSDYRGKLVFLNFWATWCGPCRFEMPSMERLYQELKAEGLEILAVDLRESERVVRRYVRENNLTFPILLDTDGKVGTTYGARSIPTTYLIDREGRLFARAVGAREWDEPEMVALLTNVLENGFEVAGGGPGEESALPETGEVKEIVIEAYNWGFDVTPVSVNKGDRLRIRVKSRGGTHGVVIPALRAASQPVGRGREQIIEATATRAGQISFACNTACGVGHLAMRGSFRIEE